MSLIGAQLADRYEILREIGRGGMGVVYLARDPLLERDVAIKVLTATTSDDRAQARFRREALVVAQMDHPGIVGVFDVGSHEGALFFVMPFVDGVQLRFLMREHALTLGDVLGLGVQVAEALEYSHQRAVVHRDIKPENLIVHRGEDGWLRVRITDFGLARAPQEHRLTLSGALIGTVAYLSPEQVAGRDVNHRADIYALGVILYECLAGGPPFAGEVPSILYRIAHERAPSLAELGIEVEPELDALVAACLAKKPEDRPARAAEVARRLEQLLRSLDEAAQQRPMFLEHRTLAYEHEYTVSDFIGREAEMVTVVGRLEAALSGSSQLVVIRGEEGIGKSRLLLEVESVARSRGFHVCRGRGATDASAPPYQAFAEALHDHLRQRDIPHAMDSLAELRDGIYALWPSLSAVRQLASAELSGPPTTPAEAPEFIAQVLEHMSGGRPLAVLLDDLHRSHESVRLLGFLLRRLTPTPTILVAAHQWPVPGQLHPINDVLTELRGDPRCALVSLGPFERDEHRQFVANLAGASLSDSMVERVFVATEGSPYLTSELVRSMLEHGFSQEPGGTLTSSAQIMGDKLRDSIDLRLAKLDDDLEEVMAAASVLGQVFDFRDLEDLCGPGEALDDAVDRLVHGGLLREDRESPNDRLRFVNGLVRDVVYDRLPRRQRKQLHKRHAEALEARSSVHRIPRLKALVDNYLSGGVPEKAVEFALLLARRQLAAGEREQADRALKTIVGLFEEAATKSPPVQEAEARSLRAELRALEGETDAALAELERAYRIFESSASAEALLDVCRQAAETAWQRRRLEETRLWVDRGLAYGDGRSSEALDRIYVLAASLASLEGDETTAAQLLRQVRDEAAVALDGSGERTAKPKGSVHSQPGNTIRDTQRTKPAPQPTLDSGLRRLSSLGTGAVRIGSGMRIDHLDPTDPSGGAHQLAPALFETLTRHSGDATAAPWLASLVEVDPSRGRVHLRLRGEVRLHDGRGMNARDVQASFERVLRSPDTATRRLLAGVRGADRFVSGDADRIDGVHLTSDRDLMVELEAAVTTFPSILSAVPIVAEGFEPTAASWQHGCIATGPFRLRQIEPGTLVELEANPHYWREDLPKANGLAVLTASGSELAAGLTSGEIQVVWDASIDAFEALLSESLGHLRVCEAPSLSTAFLACNCRSGPLADESVRHRLADAVAASGALQRITSLGAPAISVLPPAIAGSDGTWPRVQSPPAPLSEPIPLMVMILSVFEDRWSAFTDELFATLESAGFRIDVIEETHDEAGSITRWPVDLLLSCWTARSADPGSFVHGLLDSQSGEVGSLCGTDEIDRLITTTRSTADPAQRRVALRSIERDLAATARLVPLFHERSCRLATRSVADLRSVLCGPTVAFERLTLNG